MINTALAQEYVIQPNERKMSHVIIVLPTSNEPVDIFEQTITGGFSPVNTRLVFDTEIL